MSVRNKHYFYCGKNTYNNGRREERRNNSLEALTMKKHDTNRKGNARRNTVSVERELAQGLRFVAAIGGVERLRNPEFWK